MQISYWKVHPDNIKSTLQYRNFEPRIQKSGKIQIQLKPHVQLQIIPSLFVDKSVLNYTISLFSFL